eukprot:TRINITY_DN16585_c1_g1_i1.p1 TRINITY_DN16585_c1_g1~~TRINITY_DN16585_c1_g1_i1.p1  ORF type:complete len:197 (+),score=8.35 TRINITY_DN16585_c1_g1_i1:147-737(+)
MILKVTILLLCATLSQQLCTCGQPCCCQKIANKDQILSLSDQELFDMGDDQGIENCYILQGGSGNACDLYVKSDIQGTHGDRGYPKNTQCRGTGCVKAPDFPKSVTTCYYTSSVYDSSVNSLASSFCTKEGVQNAAAMLRYAISNDVCNCYNGECPVVVRSPSMDLTEPRDMSPFIVDMGPGHIDDPFPIPLPFVN